MKDSLVARVTCTHWQAYDNIGALPIIKICGKRIVIKVREEHWPLISILCFVLTEWLNQLFNCITNTKLSQITHTIFDIISLCVRQFILMHAEKCHATLSNDIDIFPWTGFRALLCSSTGDNQKNCDPITYIYTVCKYSMNDNTAKIA